MKHWTAGFAPALSFVALSFSAPAAAEVVAQSDSGFVIRLSAEVTASPQDAWKELVTPADWWLKDHTFSGDAANLYIDSQATGCFCEKLPLPKGAAPGGRPGSVEHMRIIHVNPGRVLRMSGALGPLQSEALTGTLTILLKPVNGKTRILWEYVVGGYMRHKTDQIVPAVDAVLAQQLGSLASKLGAVTVPKTRAPQSGGAKPAGGGGVSDPDFLDDAKDEPDTVAPPPPAKPSAAKPAARKTPGPDHVEPTR